MFLVYLALAISTSLLVVIAGVAKLQRVPKVVKVINEVGGVPMKWFPWLAACEFAGALGLLLGLAWAPLELSAAAGLVICFLGAIIAHLRVGDVKGISTPAFPLGLAIACLVTRLLSA